MFCYTLPVRSRVADARAVRKKSYRSRNFANSASWWEMPPYRLETPYFITEGHDSVPFPVLTPFKICGCRSWAPLARNWPNFMRTGAVRVFLVFVAAVCILAFGQYQANFYRSRKQNIFQHFGKLFLPETLKGVPCCLNELVVNFREEPSGIGRLCRLEVPTDGQLAKCRFFIETGWIARNRWPVPYHSPSFDFSIETGPVGHPFEFEPAKSANPTRFLSKFDQ